MSASSSSSSGRGGPKKTRRKRSNISGEILQCLEKFYQNKPHPDSQERRQLALELGETENLVRIWFQNRRAKRQRVRNQLLLQEVSKHGGKGQSTDDKSLSKSPTTIPNSDGRKKASSSDDGTSSSILFPSSHHIQPSSSLENIHSSVQAKLQASCQAPMGEMPLMLDVHLYPQILTRIIGMVAAGESILKESDADFYESLKDAHYGILLKDNKKLLYNKIYGLHVVDCL